MLLIFSSYSVQLRLEAVTPNFTLFSHHFTLLHCFVDSLHILRSTIRIIFLQFDPYLRLGCVRKVRIDYVDTMTPSDSLTCHVFVCMQLINNPLGVRLFTLCESGILDKEEAAQGHHDLRV